MDLFEEDYGVKLPIQSLEIDKREPSLSLDELELDESLNDNILDVSFGKRETNVNVKCHAKWF